MKKIINKITNWFKTINSDVNNENKVTGFKLYEVIIIVILVSVTCISITYLVTNKVNSLKKEPISSSKYGELKDVGEIYDIILNKYYKEVDKKKLLEAAINGMLGSLGDNHSLYFDYQGSNDFESQVEGKYSGIGVEIIQTNNGVVISRVFENTPASESGLKEEDIIFKIEGIDVIQKNTAEISSLIKGKENTKVKITVLRNNEEISFDVERKNVSIPSITSKVMENKVGYIKIDRFNSTIYEEFVINLVKLEEQNIKSLIIDVRSNSGGYLDAVTKIASIFIPEGKTIYQLEDKKDINKVVSENKEYKKYPIVVLQNKLSASASEILASSLLENNIAKVVGTNSFGKGTAQMTKTLSNGGLLKLTTQKWLTPNGNWIETNGVTPTNFIELNEEYFNNPIEKNDNQLSEAMNLLK